MVNSLQTVQFKILCRLKAKHEKPEEGCRTYYPKCCDYNNKDEVNSPNILSNSNQFWH